MYPTTCVLYVQTKTCTMVRTAMLTSNEEKQRLWLSYRNETAWNIRVTSGLYVGNGKPEEVIINIRTGRITSA